MSISCASDFNNFILKPKMNKEDETNKALRFHCIIKRINIDFRNINNDTYYRFNIDSQVRGIDI